MHNFVFQSIIAFTDIIVSARPWRVQHFYVPLIYGIVYGLFQVIYIVGIGGKDEVINLLLFGNKINQCLKEL